MDDFKKMTHYINHSLAGGKFSFEGAEYDFLGFGFVSATGQTVHTTLEGFLLCEPIAIQTPDEMRAIIAEQGTRIDSLVDELAEANMVRAKEIEDQDLNSDGKKRRRRLSDPEKFAMCNYYENNMHLSLREIGAHYGVSSSYTAGVLDAGGVRKIKHITK